MSRLRIRLRDHVRQKTNADKAAKKNNQPLSSKAKMKLYRERLKGNPALYKAYRESEAARSRLYRASLSDRKKADQREKTRTRVQKWREKQKVKFIVYSLLSILSMGYIIQIFNQKRQFLCNVTHTCIKFFTKTVQIIQNKRAKMALKRSPE